MSRKGRKSRELRDSLLKNFHFLTLGRNAEKCKKYGHLFGGCLVNLGHLNLNQVRVFEAVFRLTSMTQAAKELGLTQSGVSQHIRVFEESLGVKLFDRIQQRLVPTQFAQDLYEKCVLALELFQDALSGVNSELSEILSGLVRIGVPSEFGKSILIPILAGFARSHPSVRFRFRIGYAARTCEMLLKGELDAAFVDEGEQDSRLEWTSVYNEMFALCIHKDLLNDRKLPSKSKTEAMRFYQDLLYVDYSEDAVVLQKWFTHHLGAPMDPLHVRATIDGVQGLRQLILNGYGAGVLPHHLAESMLSEGAPIRILDGKGTPLKNQVMMATLKNRSHSRAVKQVLLYLQQQDWGK